MLPARRPRLLPLFQRAAEAKPEAEEPPRDSSRSVKFPYPAARAVGCPPLLVRTGGDAIQAEQVLRRYLEVPIFEGLAEAAAWILSRESQWILTPSSRGVYAPLALPLG